MLYADARKIQSTVLYFCYDIIRHNYTYYIITTHKHITHTYQNVWYIMGGYLSRALFACRLSLSLWALITGSTSSSSALEQLREFLLN